LKKAIKSEYSALGIRKAPSPVLMQALTAVRGLVYENQQDDPLTLDHGCGQLRNVKSLLQFSNRLVLVDTESQLSKKHNFFGEHLTIQEYIEGKYDCNCIMVMNDRQFERSRLKVNVAFSINVIDVTPPMIRNAILRAIRRNMAKRGVFVLIVPRNDSWTLRRCSKQNRYADGYIFQNHGTLTFYRNWDNLSLETLLKRHGLRIVCDLSNYRYASMICKIR
jgi:hypothetical protein